MRVDIDIGKASSGWRSPLQMLIVALGLAAIIGSSAQFAIGFPPCEGYYCNSEPLPPLATASVRPPYFTALVGTPVSYTAETANASGSLAYQWRRSSDGGASYVDIEGATGKTLSLASVNLADDGAMFTVVVRTASGVLTARSQLAVSAVPGLVFEDGEFLPTHWFTVFVRPEQPLALHSEERIATGGHPDAFRRMVFQLPQGEGSVSVGYASESATYDPQTQGAIYVIDYAEDCIALQNSDTMLMQSGLVIEQAGRRYRSNSADTCTSIHWAAVAGRSSLAAQDFLLFDGPACQTGESCPDFSASALAMRFGYWRIAYGTPGDLIAHGIDNWTVTVWRR